MNTHRETHTHTNRNTHIYTQRREEKSYIETDSYIDR